MKVLTPDIILKARHYTEIFDNPLTMKNDYIMLCKIYHPDLHKSDPYASDVMAKINELYQDSLIGKKKPDEWLFRGKNVIIFSDKIIFTPSNLDLYLQNLNNLKYRDDDMKKEFSKYFPKILKKSSDSIETFFEDAFSMEEVLKRGYPPERHAIWMINRLYNIACYFEWQKMSHNGISLTNCLFSPNAHSIMLIGGWEHCRPYGHTILSMDTNVFKSLPSEFAFGAPESSYVNDLYAIRNIGKQLIPASQVELRKYLEGPIADTVAKDYLDWSVLYKKIFGPSKFIEYKFWR